MLVKEGKRIRFASLFMDDCDVTIKEYDLLSVRKPHRFLITAAAFICSMAALTSLYVRADEATATAKVSKDNLVEPIFRVTKHESATTTAQASLVKSSPKLSVSEAKPHPLDSALAMAKDALGQCEGNVLDYTAIIVKKERIGGKIGDEAYMSAKIRHKKRNAAGEIEIPFSVYLKFLRPSPLKGREVIYVEGRNKGKLIAHEGGFKGKFTPSIHLDPQGTLAMMGQRYPITDIGIENLCVKLLERGGRDRATGMCQVNITDANINQRPATRIEVVHPQRKQGLDFHLARIFVDKEFQLPVRYEAYDWPTGPDGKVTPNDLLEVYTYIRIKINVGLTDSDFDPENSDYNM